jgi:hypothetical protein
VGRVIARTGELVRAAFEREPDQAARAERSRVNGATLAAGSTAEFSVNFPNQTVYCRFVKASKSKVRGSLTVSVFTDDQTDHTVVVAE